MKPLDFWPYNEDWFPWSGWAFFRGFLVLGAFLFFGLTIAKWIWGYGSLPYIAVNVLYLTAAGVWIFPFVYLKFFYTEPPPVVLDIRGSLYKQLWSDAAEHNFNIPDQKTWDLMLDAGVELCAKVRFSSVFSENPLYQDREQIAYQATWRCLFAYLKALPLLEDTPFKTRLSSSYLVHDMIAAFRDDEKLKQLGAITVAHTFNQNVARVTAAADSRKVIYPQDYSGTDMAEQFLRDTPLLKLFQVPVPYKLDPKIRFEHTWIIANSGHGKTQLIQHLISYDLKEKASVIVIDSQQKLVDNIASLDLGDRLVLIDPTVAVPAINLFKLGSGDANQTLEMYRFMFGSLLDSAMTDNQRTLFDNAALLLAHVPNATFMDFYKLMDGEDYSRYYDKLDAIGRRFFERDFSTKGPDGYEANRKQIIRRLNTLMRTYPFTQMFAQSESKIDLEREMNAGKVILINTSTAKLGREGSKFFGRFFLALIANATTQRQHQSNPLPVYCYVDEADQYAKDDPTIQDLLARARKNNVGLILAHRWLEEMGTTAKALESTASIIFAGGLRASDLSYMSKVMECDPKLLQGGKGTFAVYQRGKPVVQLTAPFGTLEKMPRLTAEQYAAVKEEQKTKYGTANAPPPPDIPLVDAT
ncbi:MAG: hypothetical protein ACK4UO_13110 [Pseudolabrys sp.]